MADKFRRKSATWDRRLYFPSEGRRAEDFFRPQPANLGTKGQHATSRPQKPDVRIKTASNCIATNLVAGSCEDYNEPLGS